MTAARRGHRRADHPGRLRALGAAPAHRRRAAGHDRQARRSPRAAARSAGARRAELEGVSVEEALQHPTWAMGGKITIDSATLMNKGLELIEAHHLFGTPYDRIDVVVHPQSIVHSYVLLCDGAALAHLGHPDMRVPISYALHYPERVDVPVRAARPRRGRRADLRARRHRRLPVPAPGARGGGRRRHRAVRAQRRQRGRRPRVPQRAAGLPRHPRGHRDARSSGCRPAPCAPSSRSTRPTARRARWPRADRGAHVSWILAFVGFAALIILHEFGHFAAAKATGHARRALLALLPAAAGASSRRGETEYAIGAIPLGGYVKITGMSPHEELSPEVAPRAYLNQPPWKRIVVIAAGPAMNLLIAFLLSGRSSPSTGWRSTTSWSTRSQPGSAGRRRAAARRQGALDRRRHGLPARPERRGDRRPPAAPATHVNRHTARARRRTAARPTTPAKVVVRARRQAA